MKEKVFNKNVILVLAASFFYMSCPVIVMPFITGFTGTLGGTGFLMGFIGGLMNLVALVCRPLAGNLSDRIDKCRFTQAGAGLMLLACLGYFAAPSPAILVAARVVHGIGYSFCSVGMSTWLSMLLPRNKIGAGMGLYGTVQAVSMAVMPSAGLKILDRYGYRAVFLTALAFSLATILISLCITDHGEAVGKTASSGHPGSGHTGLGRASRGAASLGVVERRVLPIALIVMLFAIPYSATQSFLVQYIARMGASVDTAVFFSFYAIVLIGLRAGLRNLFDRIPYQRFVLASIVSSMVALLLLCFLGGDMHLAFAAACMAGGYGIICSVSQAAAVTITGPEKRGLANSTYYIGLDLGMALGPILGGAVYGSVDIRLFYPLFMICPVLCAILLFWGKGRWWPPVKEEEAGT